MLTCRPLRCADVPFYDSIVDSPVHGLSFRPIPNGRRCPHVELRVFEYRTYIVSGGCLHEASNARLDGVDPRVHPISINLGARSEGQRGHQIVADAASTEGGMPAMCFAATVER